MIGFFCSDIFYKRDRNREDATKSIPRLFQGYENNMGKLSHFLNRIVDISRPPCFLHKCFTIGRARSCRASGTESAIITIVVSFYVLDLDVSKLLIHRRSIWLTIWFCPFSCITEYPSWKSLSWVIDFHFLKLLWSFVEKPLPPFSISTFLRKVFYTELGEHVSYRCSTSRLTASGFWSEREEPSSEFFRGIRKLLFCIEPPIFWFHIRDLHIFFFIWRIE